jgi:hypothetical protein
MSRNLTIDVNVNPNGVASATETKLSESSESNKIQQRASKNTIQTAAIISVIQRGANIGIANIGELTGNKSLQRNAAFISNAATLSLMAIKNPAAALTMATLQVGQAAISAGIANRNLAIQRDYNRQVRLATHKNNRR